jgi:hypothetical protein
MICPTTPSGSWKWYATVFLSISEMEPVSARIAAEVVGRQRDVRGERLAHGLAVLPALRDRQRLEVLLDHVCDLVQDPRPLRRRRLCPGVLCGVGGIERKVDVLCGRQRHFRERLAGDRRHVLGVLALHRCDPVTADEVLVTTLQRHGAI